jgi:hypothetical protein
MRYAVALSADINTATEIGPRTIVEIFAASGEYEAKIVGSGRCYTIYPDAEGYINHRVALVAIPSDLHETQPLDENEFETLNKKAIAITLNDLATEYAEKIEAYRFKSKAAINAQSAYNHVISAMRNEIMSETVIGVAKRLGIDLNEVVS